MVATGYKLFLLGEVLLVVGFGWFWLLRSLHLRRIEPMSYLLTDADSFVVGTLGGSDGIDEPAGATAAEIR